MCARNSKATRRPDLAAYKQRTQPDGVKKVVRPLGAKNKAKAASNDGETVSD